MAGKSDSFGLDTFLQTAISEDGVSEVVHNRETRTVEGRTHLRASNRKPYSVCNALAQRACGDLDAIYAVVALGMTGGL